MLGKDDPRAKLDEGYRVFAAVPGAKDFVSFDKTGHESYVASHPAEWRSAVEELIGRAETQALRHSIGWPP
jgi:hypothetical protein